MIGLDLGISCTGMGMCRPGAGEVATDGPLGVEVRDRRSAGDDREAAFASALARSGSCINVVRSDRRETRFGRESTR